MKSEELRKLTIAQALAKMEAGEITAAELTEAYLEEIARRNGNLNAYLEIFSDVREQAARIDEKRKNGESVGVLAGIPLAIKDNILIRGRIASAASKILENYRATYDAYVIERLREAGVIFIGRTNMDEFAMGGSTENSGFGPTKNPHDETRVPGGSSGGSASVVGGDLAVAALGTDTGGSIRQPSSFCGTVGLKPTYGAVSRRGAIAMASSLDQIGPITKTVEDAELIFKVIRGKDSLDSTSADQPEQVKVSEPKVIGVPRSFLKKGIDPEVLASFDRAVTKLKGLGYQVVDIEMPLLPYSLAAYYVIMPAEVSTNLARYDGVRYGLHENGNNGIEDYFKTRAAGFGAEVRRRIMLGTYVLSAGYYDAYYNRATKVRKMIREEYEKVFQEVDAIITPTAPNPAFKIGEKTSDPLTMYLEDIFTVPVNIAGVPAISVPMDPSSDGLPIGLQIAAPHWREDILFAIGKKFGA